MGKRGPQPKTSAMRGLEGNPSKRPMKTAVAVLKGKPVVPVHLERYEKEVWNRIVRSVPPDFYGEIDTVILSAYCIAAGWHRKAVLELAIHGATQQGSTGILLQSPWIQILIKNAHLISALGSKLGLDPASRTSLGSYKEKPTSKFGQLLTIEHDQIES